MCKKKNTEITVQVFSSVEEIASILKSNGFVFVGDFNIIDRYYTSLNDFNVPYEVLMSNTFLLRKITENGETMSELVFKNKKIKDDVVLNEEKYITKVGDTDVADVIFSRANLNKWCELEQKNYVYHRKNQEILVQDVKNLGIFIEFEETCDMKNLSDDEKIFELTSILKQLNLKIGSDFNIKKAYLLMRKNTKEKQC